MRCYTVRDGNFSTNIPTVEIGEIRAIRIGDFFIAIPEGSNLLHYSELTSVPDPFGSINSILLLLTWTDKHDVTHSKSNAEWRFKAIEYLKEKKVKAWRGMINPEEEDIESKLSFMALIVGQKIGSGYQALGILPEGRSFEVVWPDCDVRQFLNQEGNLISFDPLNRACTEVLSETWSRIYQR